MLNATDCGYSSASKRRGDKNMKRSTNLIFAVLASLLVGTPSARAEDIDIFSGAASNGAPPQVLIILDNAFGIFDPE